VKNARTSPKAKAKKKKKDWGVVQMVKQGQGYEFKP
jgi:hypothetical protein